MPDLVPYIAAARGEVAEFLRDPPGMNIYLSSRLDAPGLGVGYLSRRKDEIEGFSWFGTGANLLLKGGESTFIEAVAEKALERERHWLMVVGAWEEVTDFLTRYRGRSRRRPRVDRVQQHYVLTRGDLPALREPGLSPSAEADVDELAGAAARMSAEDFEIDPWRIDRAAVRRSVSLKVAERRSWLLREEGRVVFKADLAARGPEGGQVEGVFTVEDRRGEGIATRCISELGHRLLDELPLLSLHVAESNGPARRAYEKAGFRETARMRLAIFPPA